MHNYSRCGATKEYWSAACLLPHVHVHVHVHVMYRIRHPAQRPSRQGHWFMSGLHGPWPVVAAFGTSSALVCQGASSRVHRAHTTTVVPSSRATGAHCHWLATCTVTITEQAHSKHGGGGAPTVPQPLVRLTVSSEAANQGSVHRHNQAVADAHNYSSTARLCGSTERLAPPSQQPSTMCVRGEGEAV